MRGGANGILGPCHSQVLAQERRQWRLKRKELEKELAHADRTAFEESEQEKQRKLEAHSHDDIHGLWSFEVTR